MIDRQEEWILRDTAAMPEQPAAPVRTAVGIGREAASGSDEEDLFEKLKNSSVLKKVPKTIGFLHFSVLEGIRTLDLPLRSQPEYPQYRLL